MTRTEIASLGEFGIINRIGKSTKCKNESVLKGIGDDAAVIDIGNEKVMLISTDMLLEGIHFDLSYTPLKHLGYKAVAVNVSDIAAMNGIPAQITVGLALSNRFSVEAIDELYEGIHLACEHYNVDLVGGDTTSSISGLVISISVVGYASKNEVVYRSGAKEGDIICVSGDLGAAYMGLQVLIREKEVFKVDPNMQPDLDKFDYMVARLLKPEARMDVVHELRDLGIRPTSMIDISDGLASEILHIATQSGVGAAILEENIPIATVTFDTLVDFNLQPISSALNGGEDYELLFTVSEEDYKKLEKHPDITSVGVITHKSTGVNLISKQKNVYPIKAQGWVHF